MDNIISHHLSQEVASDIKLLLRDLKKMLKVLTMYPDDNPLPAKMRGSFGAHFVEMVDEFNGLTFTVQPNEIYHNREIVYEDEGKEDALAADFYGAGIIHLEFRSGLSLDEFSIFLDVIKTHFRDRSLDSDLASLLWQEQLSCIKFKTVDDLALGEQQTDMTIREMYPGLDRGLQSNAEVDYNQVILDEEGKEDSTSLGSPPLSPETIQDAGQMGLSLDSPPEAPDVVSQLLSGSIDLADEEKDEIERILKENRQFDPNRSTTTILLEILNYWNDQKPFAETVTLCEYILDQLLGRGAFAPAAEFVQALRARQEKLISRKPAYASRIGEFLIRAGDAPRIQQLTEIINRQEIVDTGSIEIYLNALGWESIVHVTGMLGKLVSKGARMMVCDYLAERGKRHLRIITNGLHDKRWYVVRNTVMILGRIGGEDVLKSLAAVASHPDHRVRAETIKALGNIKSEQAVDIMCRFLTDSKPRLRTIALDNLSNVGGRKPFETVRDIIQSPAFIEYPLDEQGQFLIAFSRLGGAEVIDFLDSIIDSFSLLNIGWKAKYRMMALSALAHNVSEDAEKLILKYTRSRRKWLRQAAVTALEQHRKIVYQQGEER
jgi:hypothetical protein